MTHGLRAELVDGTTDMRVLAEGDDGVVAVISTIYTAFHWTPPAR